MFPVIVIDSIRDEVFLIFSGFLICFGRLFGDLVILADVKILKLILIGFHFGKICSELCINSFAVEESPSSKTGEFFL